MTKKVELKNHFFTHFTLVKNRLGNISDSVGNNFIYKAWKIRIRDTITINFPNSNFSLQNVLSKKILSFQNVNYNPGEIQYHTGIASIVAQIPTLFLFATSKGIEDMTGQMAIIYLFNGICKIYKKWGKKPL